MKQRTCLDCVHHHYEENEEEVEVLVCFQRRKLIRDIQQAQDCQHLYTANQDD